MSPRKQSFCGGIYLRFSQVIKDLTFDLSWWFFQSFFKKKKKKVNFCTVTTAVEFSTLDLYFLCVCELRKYLTNKAFSVFYF